MADLKSFINTSSDRIKSAMGVPVDRIKTIQGSLLNPNILSLKNKTLGYRDWETVEIGRAHV